MSAEHLEAAYVKRALKEHYDNIQRAILDVGLAGGGKVVEPHPNPRLLIFKVIYGMDESALPPSRHEHHVPDMSDGAAFDVWYRSHYNPPAPEESAMSTPEESTNPPTLPTCRDGKPLPINRLLTAARLIVCRSVKLGLDSDVKAQLLNLHRTGEFLATAGRGGRKTAGAVWCAVTGRAWPHYPRERGGHVLIEDYKLRWAEIQAEARVSMDEQEQELLEKADDGDALSKFLFDAITLLNASSAYGLYAPTRGHLISLHNYGKLSRTAVVHSGKTTAGAIWSVLTGNTHPELMNDNLNRSQRNEARRTTTHFAALWTRLQADKRDKQVTPDTVPHDEDVPATRETWDDFRANGLLWFVNSALQLFGWVITVETNSADQVVTAYPSRTKFRGFSAQSNERGFRRIRALMAKDGASLADACDVDKTSENHQ